MCIITQVICILTHKSALRLSLPVCGVVFFLKYRLPVYPHSWIMMQLEGWEREKDGYPHTWQVKCSTVDFLDAGGTVCLDAFEFVPPWLSNIPLHEWVCAWMPVYTCYPVSYPGSNAWSAADTPPTHTRKPPTPSLTAAPAVLQEGKKMGQQSSTDLAAENPNSSNNTSTPSTAHTLKRSWDSAHTALTPCISSCSFRHSVYTLESPQACLPAFLHEEMDKTENVPEAGGWGQNTRVPIYWSKCAFIYKDKIR